MWSWFSGCSSIIAEGRGILNDPDNPLEAVLRRALDDGADLEMTSGSQEGRVLRGPIEGVSLTSRAKGNIAELSSAGKGEDYLQVRLRWSASSSNPTDGESRDWARASLGTAFLIPITEKCDYEPGSAHGQLGSDARIVFDPRLAMADVQGLFPLDLDDGFGIF